MYVSTFGFHASKITPFQVFFFHLSSQWNSFAECFIVFLPKMLLRNYSRGNESGSTVTVAQVEPRRDVLLWYFLGGIWNWILIQWNMILKWGYSVPWKMIHRQQSRYTEHRNRYTEYRAGQAQHQQAAYRWGL